MHDLTHTYTHAVYIFTHTWTPIHTIFHLSIVQVICHNLAVPTVLSSRIKIIRTKQTAFNLHSHAIEGFWVQGIHQPVKDFPGSSQTKTQLFIKLSQKVTVLLQPAEKSNKGLAHVSSASLRKCFQPNRNFPNYICIVCKYMYVCKPCMFCLPNTVSRILFFMNQFKSTSTLLHLYSFYT